MNGTADDGSVDAGGGVRFDAGAVGDDAMAVDATMVDATNDVPGRDVGPEAHVCPVVDDDVPPADVPASDAPYVVELAIGSQLHQCARMSDGTVRCMGLNAEGRLGNGRTNEVNVPSTPVPGLIDVEQVVTSDMGATCTRHRDGSVRCWGSNRYDMLGTGHVGDQDCLGRPCRMSPTLVDGLTEVVYLAVGNTSICAVRRDGGVWCWGAGDRLLPAGSAATPRATRLSDVAAMWPRALGWVWRRRDGRYASDTAITGLAIPEAAGFAEGGFGYHLCYRLPNTSIRCLGGNDHGKVGNGTIKGGLPGVTEPGDPGLCGVRSVATAFANTCALLYDGTVRCWGDGSHGALGCPTAEPCDSNGMAMRPRPVAGLEGVDRVFVGVWGGCAIRRDHSVWCWGTLAPHRYGPPEPVAW